MRIIRTRPRGTNFCTNSARSAPSFVRQPNSPKCTQIVQNAPKHQFRVHWDGSGAFVARNSEATSWHKLLHSSARFAPSFARQPNGPKFTQIVRNTPKHQFRVQWGGLGAFLAKNSDATSWYELLHKFCPFCTEFRKARNGPECTQIVRNAPKRQFRVRWGGSGAFVAKNSDTT